jgi:cell division protein FtsL
MIAAEQWYEYQQQYRKFSFDMKPRDVSCEREQRKARTTPKDRFMLMVLTILLGLVCIGMIISSAYAASIKYDINTLIKENEVIQGEIENLDVEIKSAINIGNIEARAIEELGMVYPEVTQFRYISQGSEAIPNLASVIKEQAYQ